jgi:tryptophan 2,3-dioxygenase
MNEKVILEKLRKLEQKYEASGQNLESYLDGLYEATFLNYWDYIQLDTLLSLQVKRTTLPDEDIFIIYHQITELYFKLILSELKQICHSDGSDAEWMETKAGRINRYFLNLVQSFRVMSEGMDAAQFMRFRMALLPASGFQSVQYRYIELMCTAAEHLMEASCREDAKVRSLEEKLACLYWRWGSTDRETGKKTLTLTRFEEKYDVPIRDFARIYETRNLNRILESEKFGGNIPDGLRKALRLLDYQANVAWRLAHLSTASRYLKGDPTAVEATGGTNWQKYLPPRFQKVIFFPGLWTEEEKQNWGQLKEGFEG